jgi:hypothetical protein
MDNKPKIQALVAERDPYDFKDLKSRKDFLQTEAHLAVYICVPCKRVFIHRRTLAKHQKKHWLIFE